MAFSAPVTVVDSAERTESGNSGALTAGMARSVSLLVDVTAVAGTPTLDVSVEWSHDGTTWAAAETPDAFTQLTAAGTVVKSFTAQGPVYRIVWTIAGTTPSFTFSISEYVT
jgi:hypothetical protein